MPGMGIIALFLLLQVVSFCALLPSCATHVIKGVNNLSKLFPSRTNLPIFDRLVPRRVSAKGIVGISGVNLQFPELEPIIVFIGPSKSGKSTLARCIAGLDSITNGTVCTDPKVEAQGLHSAQYCVYVDHLFSSSYRDHNTVAQLLQQQTPITAAAAEEWLPLMQRFDRAVAEAAKAFGLVPTSKASELLTSQRCSLEVLIAICSCWRRRMQHRLQEQELSRSFVARHDSGFLDSGFLVVLDEYLDNEVSSVRDTFFTNMRYLTQDPVIQLQIIVITHSRGVLSSCRHSESSKNCHEAAKHIAVNHYSTKQITEVSASATGAVTDVYTVVMRNGQVYSAGAASKVIIPSDMSWIP